jgi:hypothetical protein
MPSMSRQGALGTEWHMRNNGDFDPSSATPVDSNGVDSG